MRSGRSDHPGNVLGIGLQIDAPRRVAAGPSSWRVAIKSDRRESASGTIGTNENAASDLLLAAITQTKKSSGVHGVLLGNEMTVLVALFRVIGGGLQCLLLLRIEEGKDLLVVGLMLFLRLGATRGLRLGELRDLGLLFAGQFQRLDQMQGRLEVVHETGGFRAAG